MTGKWQWVSIQKPTCRSFDRLRPLLFDSTCSNPWCMFLTVLNSVPIKYGHWKSRGSVLSTLHRGWNSQEVERIWYKHYRILYDSWGCTQCTWQWVNKKQWESMFKIQWIFGNQRNPVVDHRKPPLQLPPTPLELVEVRRTQPWPRR